MHAYVVSCPTWSKNLERTLRRIWITKEIRISWKGTKNVFFVWISSDLPMQRSFLFEGKILHENKNVILWMLKFYFSMSIRIFELKDGHIRSRFRTWLVGQSKIHGGNFNHVRSLIPVKDSSFLIRSKVWESFSNKTAKKCDSIFSFGLVLKRIKYFQRLF